jgi:uncharacterized protein
VTDQPSDLETDSSDDFEDDDDTEEGFEASDVDEDSDDYEDDDADEVAADGNRLVGGTPRTVLEYLARNIVDDPDGVFIDTSERRSRGGSDEMEIELRLHVAPADMGKVIGRRGRVAQALRQVVSAAASRDGIKATLDIVD